jgi:GDP-4-dehydro-6-deoxy-D-mannose reductase
LFEAVRQFDKPVRILHVSSGNVYGNRDSGELGFREDETPQPVSPYAASKLMAEIAARSFVNDLGMEIVIARPFNHTGPGQALGFVCPDFARSIAEGLSRGENPVLLKTGALEPRRDFSDVRDVVEAYKLLLLKGSAGETYNVSSGALVSISGIVELFQGASGVAIQTKTDPARLRGHEVARIGGDPGKITRELGWKPVIPLRQTLAELLEYWKAH